MNRPFGKGDEIYMVRYIGQRCYITGEGTVTKDTAATRESCCTVVFNTNKSPYSFDRVTGVHPISIQYSIEHREDVSVELINKWVYENL